MKMKKLMAAAMAGALCLSMAACGSKTETPDTTDDAAQTGILLGQTAALCGIIVPFLENTFDMQDYHVSADADFNADHTEWAFTVDCSIRPISLVRVLLRHGKPMYKLYKKYFK